ncbi:reverse transcriptase domain-containing protein [Tanacetum coccineum]
MAEPILNEARAEQNLVEPSVESTVKYELSEELLMELSSNTYSGRVKEDVVDHHDICNPDELCQIEEFTVVWYSVGSCEEFITSYGGFYLSCIALLTAKNYDFEGPPRRHSFDGSRSGFSPSLGLSALYFSRVKALSFSVYAEKLDLEGLTFNEQKVWLVSIACLEISLWLKANTPDLKDSFFCWNKDSILPAIIAFHLKADEKERLVYVIKNHKEAFAWKTSYIPGISSNFCNQKINFEDDVKPVIQRYFQIPIDPANQEKTTFTCPFGTYAYRRMPFGICNAPATFQRCMIAIFQEMLETFMEVFMDDFLVFGDSFGSCLLNLEQMLIRFFDFNEECFKAFETLKEKLTNASIMVLPDWSLPFELMCDASDCDGKSFIVNGHLVKIYHDEEQLNELSSEENHFMCEKGIVKGNILYIKENASKEAPFEDD